MKFLLVLVAILSAGCAFNAPLPPDATPLPTTPSSAPATIRVTASSRTDYQTAIVATVLTRDNRFVPGIPIGFSAGTGTLSQTLAITDANGSATTVVNTATNTTVTVTAGSVANTIAVVGTAPPTVVQVPFVPAPTPAPTSPPLNVAITTGGGTGGSAALTAGAPVLFGLSMPGFASAVWNFGDGSTPVSTVSPTQFHTYAAAGSYTAAVTVTDITGRTAFSSSPITIAAAARP